MAGIYSTSSGMISTVINHTKFLFSADKLCIKLTILLVFFLCCSCNHKDTECSGGIFYKSNFHFNVSFFFFHFPSCMDATSSLTHLDTQKCTATFYRVRNLLSVSTHQNVLNANDVIVFGLSNELGNTFANATALPMHTNQHMKPLSLKKSSNSNINHLHSWRL